MARKNVRVRVPQTGYIMIGSSTRDDSDEVSRSERFFDQRAQMDDAAAVEFVNGEIASLRRFAPADVLHVIGLIHRTADGVDRVVLEPTEIRGNGPTLASRGR